MSIKWRSGDIVTRKKNKVEWLRSGQVAEKLGISTKHLMNLKKTGVLIKGVHWRQIGLPLALRPTYRWNFPRCLEKLNDL
jgi:hypothetical protein